MQVRLAQQDEEDEKMAERAKERQYKEEMMNVWDRARRLKEAKDKVEKELGVALIGDEKIKQIMAKSQMNSERMRDRERQENEAAAKAAL